MYCKNRFIAGLIALLVMLCPVCACAASSINVVYNVGEKSIAVTGKVYNAQLPVTVAIASYTGEASAFSENNLPHLIKIVPVDADGSVNFDIPTSVKLASGKYSAYFSCENEAEIRKDFMLLNADDEGTRAVIEKIGKIEEYSEFRKTVSDKAYILGIDVDSVNSEDFNFALEHTFDAIEKVNTPEAFYNIFCGYCAVSQISRGETDNAVALYYTSLETSPTQYSELSDKCAEEIASVISRRSSYEDMPWVIYEDASITARLKTANNWNELKALAEKYYEKLGIDMSEKSRFNSLSSDKKSEVFVEMYDSINKCNNMADVAALFDKAVKTVSDRKQNSGSVGGSGGSGGGSFSNIKSDTDILNPAVADKMVFSDISGHFAYEYITVLAKKNIISGFPDGTYRPDAPVTRAEFSKLICTSFGYSVGGGKTFEDVLPTDWFAPYVAALSSHNILLGYGGYFRPDDTLTREDAAVIISRVAELSASDIDVSYSDRELISDYAIDAVGKLSAAGILKGDGVNFYPKNNITRGEAASVLGRVLLN